MAAPLAPPAAPAQAPALGEPPALPIPQIRVQGLKARASKLRGRAPGGPHLRDILGRPTPGARRREVKREIEQRAQAQAKATRQQQPGPVAVAVGAATGPIVERAVKTAQLNREAKKRRRAPPLGPLNAQERQEAHAKLNEEKVREAAEAASAIGEEIRTRRAARVSKVPEAGERAEHHMVPLRHGHGFPAGPDVVMEPAPAQEPRPVTDEDRKAFAAGLRGDVPLDEAKVGIRPRYERPEDVARIGAAEKQAAERMQEIERLMLEEEGAPAAHLQPTKPGPPRASDKTSGEIRADAKAIIEQWEHIAANTQLPRSQRLAAQRRADQLRRIAANEEEETK